MEKFRIKISNDEGAENPFIAWDCEPALMYESGRGYGTTDCSDGEIVEFIKQFPTNGQIIKHQKALCDILEIDYDYLCARELTKDEKADEIRWEITTSCNVEQLAQLCELFKIQHLNYTSTGYSQGDCTNVLLVLTDEFYERTGCDRRRAKEILEGSQKLFDAWIWGDVYGFTVEKATEMVKLTREDFDAGKFEDVEDELEWNHHDGCSGFYGEDVEGVVENSGTPIEVVREAFDNIDKWMYFNK